MKILVTGGTGFVGSHLIRGLLQERGNEIYALIRDRKKLENFDFKDKITVIDGNLSDSGAFPSELDVVFHLAALTKIVSPKDFFLVNHQGTRSLLEKLQLLKKLQKVVLLSSLAAAGPNRENAFLKEDMPENPVSAYGKSKLAQEKIFEKYCPAPYVIIRAPIVFGPGDFDMLDAFRILAKGILPLLGLKDRRYSVIYVKDLVKGMIAAASSPYKHELFYIANAEPIVWEKFMLHAAHLLGKRQMKKIIVPEIAAWLLAELSELRIRIFKKEAIFNRDKFREMRFPAWTCSVEKVYNLLHFQSTFSIEDAMQETIRWYQEQNLL